MNELHKNPIKKAHERYSRIYPTGNHRDFKSCFSSCFSIEINSLVFWFNTDDESTHIERITIGDEDKKENSK